MTGLIQHEQSPLTSAQLNQLFADLNPGRISERKQGGSTLSYLEAWDVKAMLIRVFGFGGWSIVDMDAKILRMDKDIPATEYNADRKAPKVQKKDDFGQPLFNWRVTAQVTESLYIHQLGTIYSGVGIASQTGPDVGEVGDFAIKTADSDALKRCAINLGTSFGLSLYNQGSTQDVIKTTFAPGQTRLDRDIMALNDKEFNAPRIQRVLESSNQRPAVPTATAPADPDVTRAAGMDKLAGGFGNQS